MYLVLYLAHVEVEDSRYSDNFPREVCEGHKQIAFENAVDRSSSESRKWEQMHKGENNRISITKVISLTKLQDGKHVCLQLRTRTGGKSIS